MKTSSNLPSIGHKVYHTKVEVLVHVLVVEYWYLAGVTGCL